MSRLSLLSKCWCIDGSNCIWRLPAFWRATYMLSKLCVYNWCSASLITSYSSLLFSLVPSVGTGTMVVSTFTVRVRDIWIFWLVFKSPTVLAETIIALGSWAYRNSLISVWAKPTSSSSSSSLNWLSSLNDFFFTLYCLFSVMELFSSPKLPVLDSFSAVKGITFEVPAELVARLAEIGSLSRVTLVHAPICQIIIKFNNIIMNGGRQ
jgi:hypothetical protein